MKVPAESIYFWMYEQGLKHVDLGDIESAVKAAGKIIRQKDYQNYWNGYYNSDLYHGPRSEDIWSLANRRVKQEPEYFSTSYLDYPFHPYVNLPEVEIIC